MLDSVRARVAGPISYAVVGLGTGSLACSVRPGDTLTYYEIDPDIARIARDPQLFTFVSECGPNTPIVIGDARLMEIAEACPVHKMLTAGSRVVTTAG